MVIIQNVKGTLEQSKIIQNLISERTNRRIGKGKHIRAKYFIFCFERIAGRTVVIEWTSLNYHKQEGAHWAFFGQCWGRTLSVNKVLTSLAEAKVCSKLSIGHSLTSIHFLCVCSPIKISIIK